MESEPDLFVVYDWLQKAYLGINDQKVRENNTLYADLSMKWSNNQRIQESRDPLYTLNAQIDQRIIQRERVFERNRLIKQFLPVSILLVILISVTAYYGLKRYGQFKARQSRIQRAEPILKAIRRDV